MNKDKLVEMSETIMICGMAVAFLVGVPVGLVGLYHMWTSYLPPIVQSLPWRGSATNMEAIVNAYLKMFVYGGPMMAAGLFAVMMAMREQKLERSTGQPGSGGGGIDKKASFGIVGLLFAIIGVPAAGLIALCAVYDMWTNYIPAFLQNLPWRGPATTMKDVLNPFIMMIVYGGLAIAPILLVAMGLKMDAAISGRSRGKPDPASERGAVNEGEAFKGGKIVTGLFVIVGLLIAAAIALCGIYDMATNHVPSLFKAVFYTSGRGSRLNATFGIFIILFWFLVYAGTVYAILGLFFVVGEKIGGSISRGRNEH